MKSQSRKNKRGDRGSLEEEQEHNESKRLNMAESTDEQPTEPPAPEPNMTELKEMLTEIQASISNILTENQLVKTELSELKAAYQSQKRQLEAMQTLLDTTKKENVALQREVTYSRKKLKEARDETDRLNEELDNLEQYTRKNSLEIHGIPEDAYESTEDVILKVGEVLGVNIQPQDIEISHKLKTRNTCRPIIAKFLNHKVKSKLYKNRTKLKHIKAKELFPSTSYSSASGREPRIFINENLTAYRRSVVTKANKMRKDELIQSVWTLDGKVFVKTSPDGSPVRIFCLEDLDDL